MRRTIGVGLVLGLAGLLVVGGLSAQQDKQPAAPPESAAAKAAAIAAKLAKPIKIDKAIDEAPLREVLEFLGQQAGVNFVINEQALSGGPGMAAQAVAAGPAEDLKVRLPKMGTVRLSR